MEKENENRYQYFLRSNVNDAIRAFKNRLRESNTPASPILEWAFSEGLTAHWRASEDARAKIEAEDRNEKQKEAEK